MLRLTPALFLLFAACSLVGPDSTTFSLGPDGQIVNQTSEAIWFFAVNSDEAALIYPRPSVTLTDANREAVVEAGGSTTLDVNPYEPGDDVVVFLYRVDGDEADFADIVRVDGEEFERTGGVTITRL